MYESLVAYLKDKNIRLEKYMFRAVLKSLNAKNNGESSRSANSWAYIIEIHGYVGDGTANHPEEKQAKKELAKYSREVFKRHNQTKKSLKATFFIFNQ